MIQHITIQYLAIIHLGSAGPTPKQNPKHLLQLTAHNTYEERPRSKSLD